MSEDNSKATSPGKKGKTASASADEQLKFLLSCIRHSINGKINFTEVAKECNIISKGAAAKRYERLMKAHGINQQAPVSPRDASVASTKVKKAAAEGKTAPAAKAGKKRKAIEAESATNNDDDDEEPSPLAGKKRVKKEVKSEIKAEDEPKAALPQFDGAVDMLASKFESVVKTEQEIIVKKEEPVAEVDEKNVFTIEDEAMFDQFLQPGDFDQSIVIVD
ncbi:MAG: hypothetical protein Q9216_005874 [Gyalolechia sp. 2 TL-2023]